MRLLILHLNANNIETLGTFPIFLACTELSGILQLFNTNGKREFNSAQKHSPSHVSIVERTVILLFRVRQYIPATQHYPCHSTGNINERNTT